jgi:hypothetical protein
LRNKTAFPSPPILKIKASPESLQAERAGPRASPSCGFFLWPSDPSYILIALRYCTDVEAGPRLKATLLATSGMDNPYNNFTQISQITSSYKD